MEIFDVLIVGAGPAGTMAGYHLAKAGLKVLILEKAHFPRRKVCGGALTQKALNELPFDVSPVVHRAVDWGYLGFRGRTACTLHANAPIAYLVERSTFDSFLLDKAVEQGADCIQQTQVTNISQNGSHVEIRTGEGSYLGRFLIGADGVHSITAKQTGFRKPFPTSLCYEARLELPQNPADTHLDTITFDFGTLWWGYGWIFPKQDHLNVGVFRNWPGKRTSRKHLERFIHQHPGLNQAEFLDIRAYPGPLGGASGPLHAGRTLLCGDAAGLADPWLGEGIYYALASGRIAAEVIRRQLDKTDPDLSAYDRQIQEHFILQFKCARRFAVLVSIFYGVNVNLLKESPTLQQMVTDLLTGKRTYTQVWHQLWSDFPKLLWRIFG
jgi:geranylgeranyl reductase family protein